MRFVRRGDGGPWPPALSSYFLNRKGARYPRITATALGLRGLTIMERGLTGWQVTFLGLAPALNCVP